MDTDKRFTKILKDPRFKRISKTERKVKIDSRFEKMFTDEKFHIKSSVDKRGKPVKETEREDLHKFYELDSEEEKDDEEEKQSRDLDEAETSSKKKDTTKLSKRKKEKKNLNKKIQKEEKASSDESDTEINFDDIRGETVTKDESGSETTEEEEIDFDDLEEGVIHGWGTLDEDVKRVTGAEAARLAVCNCDWDKINASDLFVLFNSFKTTGGFVKSVKIYPSEYGIARLKEEDLNGPEELKETLLDDDEDDAEGNDKTEGSRFHMEKLREYQLNRMKYYYAVVECDDADTAAKIYEECDGMEYEMSGTRMDLRFIPDDTTFEQEPKSVASSMPNIKSYQPSTFLNTALQQSTVRLTWDETDPRRLESTMRKFTKEDIENMDFKDYLASSSSEDDETECGNKDEGEKTNGDCLGSDDEYSDEDEENKEMRIKKYRLLMKDIEEKEKKEEGDENYGNMEVSWRPGMSEISENIVEGKNNETNINRGKKMKKKEEQMESLEVDDESDQESISSNNIDSDGSIDSSGNIDANINNDNTEDTGFDDPFFKNNELDSKKKSKKKKKKMRNLEENMTDEEMKNKKELELLLLDETEDKKHFNLKAIIEQEKNKKSKKKRKKGNIIAEDQFKLDVKDPRFDAIYSSHLYAIDPSEPNFKKTKATEEIIKETQRRREESTETAKNIKNHSTNNTSPNTSTSSSLSALVKSVKSKTQLHEFSKKRKKLK